MQINLSRQTMANWIISASNLVKPLFDKMRKELLVSEILHADETTLEVLEEPGRKPQAKSYMWVYTTGKAEEKNIVLYDYRQGRSGAYAKEFLNGFRGYVHCDGWSGYDKLEEAGIASPVIGIECEYKESTTFCDEILIKVRVKEFKGVRLVIEYKMVNAKNNNVVFLGTSNHCFIGKNNIPIMLKKDFPELDTKLKELAAKN